MKLTESPPLPLSILVGAGIGLILSVAMIAVPSRETLATRTIDLRIPNTLLLNEVRDGGLPLTFNSEIHVSGDTIFSRCAEAFQWSPLSQSVVLTTSETEDLTLKILAQNPSQLDCLDTEALKHLSNLIWRELRPPAPSVVPATAVRSSVREEMATETVSPLSLLAKNTALGAAIGLILGLAVRLSQAPRQRSE